MSRLVVPPEGTLVQVTFTATVWDSTRDRPIFAHHNDAWLVPSEVIDSIEVADERQQLRRFLADRAWAAGAIDSLIAVFDRPDCPVVLEPRPQP